MPKLPTRLLPSLDTLPSLHIGPERAHPFNCSYFSALGTLYVWILATSATGNETSSARSSHFSTRQVGRGRQREAGCVRGFCADVVCLFVAKSGGAENFN